MEQDPIKRSPWAFIPLLYFLQAIPVTIVQEVSVVVYKDLGLADAEIARWTSLIALPWGLQMLLGPFVDLSFSKRGWILGGQAIIAALLIVAAWVLRTPNLFGFSLLVLGLTAVMSALCNIATDGFAILAMSRTEQAQFAGIMSTFYRLGRLFCASLLVFVAGKLIAGGAAKPQAWFLVLAGAGVLYGALHLATRAALPRPEVTRPSVDLAELRANGMRTLCLLMMGVGGYFLLNALVRLVAHGISVGSQVWGWNLAGWRLPGDNQIPFLGLALGPVWTEVVQLVACDIIVSAGYVLARKLFRGSQMAEALRTFAAQDGFPAILFFVLFYRFGEAMVGKISVLFLKAPLADGGLGLDNQQIGLLNGFLGVLGIVLGGIVGGLVVSKIGLRRAFLPLALAMHVPNLLYLLAAYRQLPMASAVLFGQPLNATVGGILFVDQFGYGFGFAGYMVYLMWVAQRGSFQTSHYAIGTGLGALCIAGAGVLSGVIVGNFGYTGVFWAVIFMSIPGLVSLLFVPLDDSHRAIKVEVD